MSLGVGGPASLNRDNPNCTGDPQAPGSATRVFAARRRPPGDGCPAGYAPPLGSPLAHGLPVRLSRQRSLPTPLAVQAWHPRGGRSTAATLGRHTMAQGVCAHTPDVGRHGPWYSVTQRGPRTAHLHGSPSHAPTPPRAGERRHPPPPRHTCRRDNRGSRPTPWPDASQVRATVRLGRRLIDFSALFFKHFCSLAR